MSESFIDSIIPLLGEQTTAGDIGGWVNAGAMGLLAAVLSWVFGRHLPAKDSQVDKLISDKDTLLKEQSSKHEAAVKELAVRHEEVIVKITDEFNQSMKEMLKHCRDESKSERDFSERKHNEQLEWLKKIHETGRESVHATRNLGQSMHIRTKLADAFQSTELPAWTKSLDGTVMSFNLAAERILGWKQGEVVGRRGKNTFVPADKSDEEDHVLATIGAGQVVEEYETTRSAKNGRIIPFSVVASPIRDQTGRVVGCSVIARPLDSY